MTLEWYVNKIKRALTGGIVYLEITDDTIADFVRDALDEVQRYIDSSVLVEVPFASCIDLKDFKCHAIVNIYRTDSATGDTSSNDFKSTMDPMQAQKWMAFSSGGTSYNLNDWISNYAAWNTINQLINTTSTPLSWVEKNDKDGKKLYINCNGNTANRITIEYIPIYDSVEQIQDDYWIDILYRLSLALVKVALGRARTRFKVSNNQYTDDGDTILEEGKEELNTLRELLRVNNMQFIPID